MITVKERDYKSCGYKIEKDAVKVVLTFKGFLSGKDMNDFVNDYNEVKASVNVKDTILVLDCTLLKVFPKNIEEDLGKFYVDYTQFKKVYAITLDNVTVKLQMERMWRKNNISDKFTFISSLNEAK